MSSLSVRRQQPRIAFVYAVVAVIAALAIAGSMIAFKILTSEAPAGIQGHQGAHGIGHAVETSFGVVAVQHAEKLGGLTSQALGGMTHGINGLVTSEKMQVQVSTTITNLSDETVDYSPAQFTLRNDKGKKVGAFGSSIGPGTLQPDAAVDARITFVVPRKDASFELLFSDPEKSEPIVIDLGRFNVARDGGPAGGRAGGGHDH